VHLGDGDWIVVDSCVERKTARPIALEYLEKIGVDVASQVRLVIATHWHDDHIRGLSAVLAAAKNAKFVTSAAHSLQDLTRLAVLSGDFAPQSSATREYHNIIQVLLNRRQVGERRDSVGPIKANANKKLLTLSGRNRTVDSEVFALSPSDGVLNLAEAELRNALTAMKSGRRPVRLAPNQICVVLWLQVGSLNALLGADLEHVSGTTEGWQAIIKSDERPNGLAGFFKVPHHGSDNADCPESWTTLMPPGPVAIVTPYSPSRLPREVDIARLSFRTDQLFLTSDLAKYSLPRRVNPVEKTLRELSVKRRALMGQMGHVQLRCSAVGPDEPRVTLTNGATRCAVPLRYA